MKRKHVLVALICIAICLSYVMTACSPETNEIPRNFEAACFPGSNVILYKADPTLLPRRMNSKVIEILILFPEQMLKF